MSEASLFNHKRWHNEDYRKSFVKKTSNENNCNWKGDGVGYTALHEWIRKHKPKPIECGVCHRKLPLEVANISELYKRDLNDWEWICRKCHMEKDGRMSNLVRYRGK